MKNGEILAALSSPEGRDDPYPLFAALHRLGPVTAFETRTAKMPHTAIVNGYAAVDQVLRDPNFLLTDAAFVEEKNPDWRDNPVQLNLLHSTMFSNPPHHSRMRRLFQQVFTPRRVTLLEPEMAQIAEGMLDRMAELGAGGVEVDFMTEFAYPFPSTVVGRLLGIRTADLAWFRPRVDAINTFLDLGGKNPGIKDAANSAADDIAGYYRELIAETRARPGDDLLSDLIAAVDSGEHTLSETELIGNMMVTFNAGFVTTVHMFGNGLALLLDRPDARAALRTDPAVAGGYVEEIIRSVSPVHHIVRRAGADTEVGGVPIPKGGTVLVMLAAANRDPARFPNPDVFDHTRPLHQAISFGAGPHYCLGSALARAEGRVAFPLLLNRFPKLAMGKHPDRNTQVLLRGYTHLPVTLD